jgi:DNA-binding NtrC family response regulator
MPELLFFRDGELQMRAALRQERTSIGRAPQSDFVVPDREVSRSQCEIVQRGSGYALVDLSGNGTPVTKRHATATGTLLKDGDEIYLGTFSIVFSAAEAPVPPEPTSPARHRGNRTAIARRGESAAVRTSLRVRLPEGETVIPLRPENGYAIVLGSDPRGTVQLELKDEFVSANHCKIAWKDRWVLTDLASRNGTFVDGVRVLECVLSGNAQVRIGETLVLFEQELSGSGRDQPLPGLVSRDPSMRPVIELVQRIAPSQVPMAIHGETGAGKEVIARAIHLLSSRRDGPFVALNCGAIPAETVESELFGHEKGAFTGADRARPGAFTEANGGTLFLDEVGELPLQTQVKLLRVLERGEIRRVGGSRTEEVSVRIVSATHRDLSAAVTERSFREDLYYRLFVAPVELPPLRQRLGDVMPLAEFFAAGFTPGQPPPTFASPARARLEGHSWPGNVRELRNVVQMALLNRTSGTITADDIILRPPPKLHAADSLRLVGRSMDEIEREAYRLSLLRHNGDRVAVIKELGVSRSTFFRKMDEYGLSSGVHRVRDQAE